MNEERIRVVPLGDHWDVESQDGTSLSHEESEAAAMQTARSLAEERGIDTFSLHKGAGVETEVHVGPAATTAPPEEESLPDRMEAEPVAQILHRGREQGF